MSIYDKRIKIRWPEGTIGPKRKKKDRRRGTESEYEKRERHKISRNSKMTKLHGVGSRCQFSILPFSLFQKYLQKFKKECREEPIYNYVISSDDSNSDYHMINRMNVDPDSQYSSYDPYAENDSTTSLSDYYN